MRRRIMAFLWISSVFPLKLQNARYILLLEMYRLCHLTVSRDMGTLFSDTAHFIRERIMHMRRRLLAWVLVLAMGLSGVPIPALAEETPETPEEIVEKLKAENPQNTYTPTENGIEVKAKIKEHKLTVMCSDGKFDMLLSWLDREGYFFMTEE